MRTAVTGAYNPPDFIFLELKQEKMGLHPDGLKLVRKIEKKIIAALKSRSGLKKEIEICFPDLFELRMQGVKWISSEKQNNYDAAADELYPLLSALSKHDYLKKLNLYFIQAISAGRAFMRFMKQHDLLNNNDFNPKNLDEITFETYYFVIMQQPPAYRTMLLRLLKASLGVEFCIISALLINEGEIRISPARSKQLEEVCRDSGMEYIAVMDYLLRQAKDDLLQNERNEWNAMSLQAFAAAYDQDEYDYDDVLVREPNPDYRKKK